MQRRIDQYTFWPQLNRKGRTRYSVQQFSFCSNRIYKGLFLCPRWLLSRTCVVEDWSRANERARTSNCSHPPSKRYLCRSRRLPMSKMPLLHQKEQSCHINCKNERANMRIVSAFLLLAGASAFTSPMAFHAHSALSMVSSSSTDRVPITITGNNIDVTEALAEYINKKLERPFGKLRSNGLIRDCDVHLSVNRNPRVRMLVVSEDFFLFISSQIFQSSHR